MCKIGIETIWKNKDVKILGINIDVKLKFHENIMINLLYDSRNLSVLAQILNQFHSENKKPNLKY